MEHIFSSFTEEQINRLFPFYMVIDRDMHILSCGKSLQKLCPGAQGKILTNLFQIKRPGISGDFFEGFRANIKQLIIMQCHTEAEIILRGEIEYIESDDKLLFIGSPWLSSVEQMNNRGLVMTDFAVHDNLPDLMLVLKTQQNANEDVIRVLDQLKEQKEELRKISSIVESYMHPVIICDASYKTIWVNDAFVTELEFPLEEVAGRCPVVYLFDGFNSESVTGEIRDSFYSGQSINRDLLTRSKSGKIFWVNLQGQTIRNAEGEIVQFFFILQNVEHLKEAEKKILDSLQKEIVLSDLKSRFIAMASHQFRTPMTVIKLQVELIELWKQKNQPADQESLHSHLQVIDNEIDRLTQLIGDILMVDKIEDGDITLETEKVSMVEIIKTDIQRYNGLIDTSGSIQLLVYGQPRPVLVDKGKMSHILDNLISNAVKYSKGCPPPVITLSFLSTDFTISVKDFGIGIPRADQEKIFNSFFRASNVENISGTGIGMFIVKKFVELHGGKLHLKSVENTGTEFSFSIPYLKGEGELVINN